MIHKDSFIKCSQTLVSCKLLRKLNSSQCSSIHCILLCKVNNKLIHRSVAIVKYYCKLGIKSELIQVSTCCFLICKKNKSLLRRGKPANADIFSVVASLHSAKGRGKGVLHMCDFFFFLMYLLP